MSFTKMSIFDPFKIYEFVSKLNKPTITVKITNKTEFPILLRSASSFQNFNLMINPDSEDIFVKTGLGAKSSTSGYLALECNNKVHHFYTQTNLSFADDIVSKGKKVGTTKSKPVFFYGTSNGVKQVGSQKPVVPKAADKPVLTTEEMIYYFTRNDTADIVSDLTSNVPEDKKIASSLRRFSDFGTILDDELLLEEAKKKLQYQILFALTASKVLTTEMLQFHLVWTHKSFEKLTAKVIEDKELSLEIKDSMYT